jgi:N6-adenosine-specific RNA methylase IME4
MSNELIWMSQAATAISKIATVVDAKAYADKAAAIRLFARKQGWSVEQRANISEIEIRAVAKMGELLKETEKSGPKYSRGGGSKGSRREPLLDSPSTLSESGVTKKQSSRAQQAASVPAKERERYIAENKEKDKLSVTGLVRIAKEKKREDKRAADRKTVESATAPSELTGVFSTIVIDPPWNFGDEGDCDQFGRGKPDYATMTIEQIAALPVGERAANNAHLYLWITNRSLPKGFALLEAWGFRYVTCLTWCKPSFGLGNYFRGSTEQILFGVRGTLSLKRKDVGTWFDWPRPKKKHSSKPSELYDFVESCSHGPYLEMFSRSAREGWTHWGASSVK